MKTTGIIRRIDDLGRIVIPKEIRKTLKIEEGDPIEIYTNNNTLILEKYVPTGEEQVINTLEEIDAFLKGQENPPTELIEEVQKALKYITE